MSMPHVTSMADLSDQEPKISSALGPVLLHGNGVTKAWSAFASQNSEVSVGIWESQAFAKKKTHPDSMEFCYILEGEVELSDNSGNVVRFGPGDSFVVQPGFDGVWTSLTPVRKYFVVAKC